MISCHECNGIGSVTNLTGSMGCDEEMEECPRCRGVGTEVCEFCGEPADIILRNSKLLACDGCALKQVKLDDEVYFDNF